MRKLISILSVLALSLSLTSCIPSGNIVGNATFTTIESTFASQGDAAQININAGIVATPKGLRVRVNKATFSVNGLVFRALKNSEFIPANSPSLFGIDLSRASFANSRLKGKNFCGGLMGSLEDGTQILMAVGNIDSQGNQAAQIVALDENSQPANFWIGYAPDNSLKIGGRNLCANFGWVNN